MYTECFTLVTLCLNVMAAERMLNIMFTIVFIMIVFVHVGQSVDAFRNPVKCKTSVLFVNKLVAECSKFSYLILYHELIYYLYHHYLFVWWFNCSNIYVNSGYVDWKNLLINWLTVILSIGLYHFVCETLRMHLRPPIEKNCLQMLCKPGL